MVLYRRGGGPLQRERGRLCHGRPARRGMGTCARAVCCVIGPRLLHIEHGLSERARSTAPSLGARGDSLPLTLSEQRTCL